MRTIRYKLLEYFENGTVQLFNLRDDMGEQNDLSKIEGRKAKELTAKLHQWRKDVDAQMMPPNPDYDIALDPWSGKETSKGSKIVNALGYMNTSTQKLILTYSRRSEAVSNFGTTSGWNHEYLWCNSYDIEQIINPSRLTKALAQFG